MGFILFALSAVIFIGAIWILSLYSKLRVLVRKVEGAKADVVAHQLTAREHLSRIASILEIHYGFEKFRIESYMETVRQVTNTPVSEKSLIAVAPKVSLPDTEIRGIVESELRSLDQLRREFLGAVISYNAIVTELNTAKSGLLDGLVNDRFFGIPDGLYLESDGLQLLPIYRTSESHPNLRVIN
jgi:hypothetical protein